MIKIPNLKPMIVEEYQSTEIFLLKAILQICKEKLLWLKKVQNNVPCTHAISDLNGEKIVETFYKKELGKINVKEFRIEKVIKKKETSYMSNGNDMIFYLTVWLRIKT